MDINFREKLYNKIEWKIDWPFPAPFVHNGIPIANGVFGALIYGDSKIIKININRADFWDHRGSLQWNDEMSYSNIKKLLHEKNEKELDRIFNKNNLEGIPERPTRLPMGRYEIVLDSWQVSEAFLDIEKGEAVLHLNSYGKTGSIRISMIKGYPALAISVDSQISYRLIAVPVSEEVFAAEKSYSSNFSVELPKVYKDEQFTGWTQILPNDPALCVLALESDDNFKRDIIISAVYGNRSIVVEECKVLLKKLIKYSYVEITSEMKEYWKKVWERSALIVLEDKEIEKIYYLGLYKMISISMPGGPAATLQGPWVEDFRMPPWSCDYHFNINVQECYWSAYASNNLEVLEPLFNMIENMKEKLKQYAKIFAEIDGGLQMPHAVDDRGNCMGGFWTGSIDHGSTSWVGFMLWQYYKYTMDDKFLKSTVFPFLKGTLKVYLKMLQKEEGGYVLPVSVSPEYGGASINAWGSNASFQLANIHFLCNSLLYIIKKFNFNDDIVQKCRDITNNLPLFCKGNGKYGEEIFLWEAQPLSESHRHHSHLAGVYPFDTFDYYGNPDHCKTINNSFKTLADKGMGSWAGWSFPWSAALYSRIGNGEMAELMLQIFKRFFMMKGYATSHDAQIKGLSNLDKNPDIMQVEAAAAVPGAILEMLLFTSNDIMHIFPAVPDKWSNIEFCGIRVQNGFIASGQISNGTKVSLKIKSYNCSKLRLYCKPFRNLEVVFKDKKVYNMIEDESINIDTEKDGEYLIKFEISRSN